MVKGVQMNLMIGPGVPIPVPREVIEALTDVKVIASSGAGSSGFELTFNLSPRSPLHTVFLLSGGSAIPVVRVVIVVTMNGRAEVLMDGMMTHHEVQAGVAGAQTQLVVQAQLARLVFVSQGQAPYVLLAGAEKAPPAALAVVTLVPALDDERARFGHATLGEWSEVTEVARAVEKQQQRAALRPWLLWAVLLAGVGGLAFMVWRLTRPAPPPA